MGCTPQEHVEFWRDPALPYLVDARSTHLASEPFRLHTHDCLLLSLVEAGHSQVLLGRQARVVRPGVVAVIPPGAPHACNPMPGKEFQYRSLFLHPDWLAGLSCGAGGAFLEQEALRQALVRAYTIFKGPGDRLAKDEAFQELLAVLATVWPGLPAQETDPTRLPDATVRRIQDHLLAHLGRVVTLEELAAEAGLSPFQLLRRFQRRVGLSPHAWQMQRRIELAKELLARGLAPAAAAQETGFADQSHFHRVFKRHVGATPGQYQLGSGCKIVQFLSA